MDERERIRNILAAKKMLVTMSEEEMLQVVEDEEIFNKFIIGVSEDINAISVCYIYKYKDILQKVISKAIANGLVVEDEVHDRILTIVNYLDEYASKSYNYRSEFTAQHRDIESRALGLNKLNISLEDMNKNLIDMFNKIDSGDIASIRYDSYYLVTLNYLAKHHPNYIRKLPILDEVRNSLSYFNKNNFNSIDEYKSFKKAASMTDKLINLACQPKQKFKEKVKKKLKN